MSELPPGWTYAPIEDLGELRLGKMLDKAKNQGLPAKYLRNINVRWFRFDLEDMHTIFASPAELEQLSVEDGDLFVCEGGEPGRCAVWRGGDNVFVYQKALHRFRGHGGMVPELLMYRLRHDAETGALADAFTGTTIKHLTRESLARFKVPVPPLPEQKRIADKLDALLARVDACRERLDRVPGILKRFRQSVLAAATSGELTREWREARGLDGAWDELPLEEIIEGKPRNGYSPKAVEHATPVKSLTLTATTTGRFRGEHFKYIDEQIPADSHLWLRPGDVLIQRANTLEYVGVSAVFDGPENTFIYPDLMMKCRANKRVLPAFLHLVLSSQPVRKYFRENATGTAGNMPKINQQTVLSAPAVVPSIEEQKQIVARTTELLGMADALERAHTAALAKVTKLTPSALAKAFRGELVPQDPADEPAAALLAKLKTEQASAAAEPSRRRPKTTGKRPTMSNTDKDSIKAAILKLKTDRFSFDELRAQVSGDYESLKAALFELLEEPSPVVRQVFDMKAKAMHLVRVRP